MYVLKNLISLEGPFFIVIIICWNYWLKKFAKIQEFSIKNWSDLKILFSIKVENFNGKKVLTRKKVQNKTQIKLKTKKKIQKHTSLDISNNFDLIDLTFTEQLIVVIILIVVSIYFTTSVAALVRHSLPVYEVLIIHINSKFYIFF